MNLFDGGFRSKPNISYAGSRRPKTREDLLREATNERLKRETDKRQLNASVKIQSAYRSYLVRKKIKDQYRREFDAYLANKNDTILEQKINYLLTIFVKFFTLKHDKDRLVKFNPIVIKHKETLLSQIAQNQNSSISLPKFLVIQLKFLNSPDTSNVQSNSLRIIEFFTDAAAYKHNQSLSILIFNHLINNGYIKELVSFSLIKIPASVQHVTKIPIAASLAQLFYRCFMYLRPLAPNENQIESYNKNLIDSLSNELFGQSSVPQIKCIIEHLAKIIDETDTSLDKMFLFLSIYSRSLQSGNSSSSSRSTGTTNTAVPSPAQFEYANYSYETIRNNINRIYSLANLTFRRLDKFQTDQFIEFLTVLKSLLIQIPILRVDASDDDEDDEERREEDASTEMDIDMPIDSIGGGGGGRKHAAADPLVVKEILRTFDSIQLTDKIEATLAQLATTTTATSETLRDFCLSISYICCFVLLNSNVKIHKTLLLRRLAFNKQFLTNLWHLIGSLTIGPQLKQEIYLLKMLANGSIPEIYETESMKIVAPLSTFCSLYNLFLLPILDEEFLRGEAIFSKMDLIKVSSYLKDACVGIVTLMHPEVQHTASLSSSSSLSHHHEPAASNHRHSQTDLSLAVTMATKCKAKYFAHLFKSCSQLVQRMFIRDLRFGYCPENHWLSTNRFASIERLSAILNTGDNGETLLSRIRFGQTSYLFQEELQAEIKLSLNEIRALTVLQELPFTIPFEDRVQLMESFNKINEHSFHRSHFNVHKIRIRRKYLYEDAFEKLSLENIPDFQTSKVQVEMVNEHGLDEVGIDGGGVFREFILELIETGFNPIRGFFVLTSDGYLYPNPNVGMLMENFREHYTFLGRVIAKAMQMKILTPLKFASFFLQKILSKSNATRLDIDYLASLDPQVYKNLILLKHTHTNVNELELTFAVDLNEFGQTKLVELKPGGRDIPVTNDNKIEYIHLLADYKLNRQIHEQVQAFKSGIASVVNTDMLKMFNFNEIQNLISGSNDVIDVTDWMNNTVYYEPYNREHAVIRQFWSIVDDMSEAQKKKLLKFATSRSRPPLFGFKNLIPNFAIQRSDAERLPTASTCMNLLKLPMIDDYDVLKEKLVCAIESDAGFELS